MKKLCTIFAIFLLLCGGLSVSAQTNRYANGTEGTDFWFSFPICWGQSGGNNALKIYVSCEVATQCTLEIPGLGKKIVKTTKPHDVIDFTLLPLEGQPYEKTDEATGAKTEEETYANGKGRGIHVYADVPITVYGVSRFVYTSDSFIALPVSSLGTEYIVASYADVTGAFPNQHLPSQAVIVAAYDSTFVTFKLGGSTGTKTVGGMAIGETKTFMMNKGDVVAFANKKVSNVYGDLSGSKITSDKPIAVTSGNMCAYVDVQTPACDFIMEMELPTHTWGKEYHVTKFSKRKKYSFLKIFAREPDTKLYRDGNAVPFAVLTTAGGKRGTGYYEGRVLDDEQLPRPIVIKGDKPISITQYNPGQVDDGVNGDPFQLVLTPIEQYPKEITFNTPGIKGGQGFAENYVNIVFESDTVNSVPDDLEFGTVTNDTVYWMPIKTLFGSVSEPFQGFSGDTKKYFQKIIMLSGDGVYKIRAKKPFAAYSYGADHFDSYANPTSLIMNDITVNDDTAPAIVVNNDNGESVDLTVEDAGVASSRISRVFLNPSTSSNFVLKTANFIPGQAQSVDFRTEVVNPFKDAKAEIVVVDRAGNHSLKTLSYKGKDGGSARFLVTDVSFGTQKAGSISESYLTLVNMGSEAGTIISYTSPKNTAFKLVDWPAFPLILEPNEDVLLKVQLNSQEAGYFIDSIKFIPESALADLKTTARLSGQLIAASYYTEGVDLGVVKLGEEKTGYAKLINFGPDLMNIVSVEVVSDPNFTIDPAIGQVTLQVDDTLYIPVNFSSSTPGIFQSQIRIVTQMFDLFINAKAVVEKPSSIERVYDPSFNISPNPATGFTTINLPAFKSQNPFLKVFDALGNEVVDISDKITEEGNSDIRFSTLLLPNGIYFIRLTDGTQTFSRTLIVQN